MSGSTLAGVAFSNASVALVHGMSRPVGAAFHAPHGLTNAMLLSSVTEFSLRGLPTNLAGQRPRDPYDEGGEVMIELAACRTNGATFSTPDSRVHRLEGSETLIAPSALPCASRTGAAMLMSPR